MPRSAEAATATEPAQRDVQDLAADEVDAEAVQATAQERPDREVEPVTLRVAHERARERRREHTRDAGEPDDRAYRILPRSRRLVGVVAQRREDGTRALEDEQRPQQPGLLGCLRLRSGSHYATAPRRRMRCRF